MSAKLCPLLFGGAAAIVIGNTEPGELDGNTDEGLADFVQDLSACKGSACMMWRRSDEPGTGYCGLADKPRYGTKDPKFCDGATVGATP